VDETAEPGPPHVRPEDMRAGDADREQLVERLRVANTEGRLDADELVERITAALAARTYGELAALVADLPGDPPSPRPIAVPLQRTEPPRSRASGSGKAPDLGPAAAAWVGVTVTMVVIWVVGCVAAGTVFFPWWLLVATPWGLGLLRVWMRHQGPTDGRPGGR
jgi:hypothetical protein